MGPIIGALLTWRPRSIPFGEVLRTAAEQWTRAQRQEKMSFLKLSGPPVQVCVAVLDKGIVN